MSEPLLPKYCPKCGTVMRHYVEGQKVRRNRWRCRTCYNAKRAPIARAYYQRKKARLAEACCQ